MKKLLRLITPPIVLNAAKSVSASWAARSRAAPSYYEAEGYEIRFIYMHVHKCAGTSMWRRLQIHPGFLCCVPRPGKHPHGLGRELIQDDVWRDSFKFTFVRNPYARLLSAYSMFRRSSHWQVALPTFDTFIDLVRWSDVDNHSVDAEIPMPEYSDVLDNIIHHCSSFHNPKYNLDEMDYIGRVEHLPEHMEAIRLRLALTTLDMPRLNATKHRDYRDYYSRRARKIVYQKYIRDLERFEYTF